MAKATSSRNSSKVKGRGSKASGGNKNPGVPNFGGW
jgi:hypothetical protein